MFTRSDFGEDFVWGIAQASYQTEGAINVDNKTISVWDDFSHKKRKIERNENGDIATDFYHKFPEDLALAKQMNFKAFRFSLAWTRIIDSQGKPNPKGIDFYNRVIDKCLELGLEPWITLYHWDHPQYIEMNGGWTNREMLNWFSIFADIASKSFGDRVKNWMVLNEPFSYTFNGYFTGEMAPGKKGMKNFLRAVHHSNLCQAEGGRIIRNNVENSNIGTTHFMSQIDPYSEKDKIVASKIDAIVNRIYLEPSLGMGYPKDILPLLSKIEKYVKQDDLQKIKFDFDFIGLQYYFRLMFKKNIFMPYVGASEVKPKKRKVQDINEMGAEVYPKGLYKLLKRLDNYNIKKIYITENGVCYKDELKAGIVDDNERIEFFKQHIEQILKAKNEGVNVDGYFVWSLTDNFEWDKGFRPRFGLVYIDYSTLKRYMKNSGKWFKKFLSK